MYEAAARGAHVADLTRPASTNHSRPLHLVARGGITRDCAMVVETDQGAVAATVTVTPQPKTDQCSVTDYLEYFEAVATANGWDDSVKARVFPALLGFRT